MQNRETKEKTLKKQDNKITYEMVKANHSEENEHLTLLNINNIIEIYMSTKKSFIVQENRKNSNH